MNNDPKPATRHPPASAPRQLAAPPVSETLIAERLRLAQQKRDRKAAQAGA